VITLPPLTSVKERLAVSFAIAQSAVLTIFEARVEKKTEEYKYIPETLALSGKVNLSPKQLGTMIGKGGLYDGFDYVYWLVRRCFFLSEVCMLENTLNFI
jgi:uncharacterized Rmd1/YagE family protein